MRRVMQTAFGEPGGDCFAACVASILELPVGEVPNFCAAPGDWWAGFQQWLAARRLVAVRFDFAAVPRLPFVAPVTDGALMIAEGRSPRAAPGEKLLHAVVVGGLWCSGAPEVVHDPHPSNAGIPNMNALTFLGNLYRE